MPALKRYDFSTLKVLCVDDSDFFLEVFRDILAAFGVKHSFQCNSAAEAIEYLPRCNPDLVFLDWEMQVDTAEDFLNAVRHDENHPMRTIPIVLLTGYTEIHRIHRARDLGINEFIVKPISAKNLHGRLIKLIENPRRFYSSKDYFGPDRRRRQVDLTFDDRRQK